MIFFGLFAKSLNQLHHHKLAAAKFNNEAIISLGSCDGAVKEALDILKKK